jgi:hypothetical protein
VFVGVGRGVLVAAGCVAVVGKGVSVATGCTVDSGGSVAVGSKVDVTVGCGEGVGVLVCVGCAAISRAWAVAVARTLSTRDMEGVASGRSVSNPYPPSRQDAGNRQSSMKAAKAVQAMPLIRSGIDIAPFLYESEGTIPHV